jgi:hypothetical protein
MPVQGKSEVILKISQYPDNVKTVTNGWKEFDIESNGRFFRITIKPKIFNKLDESKKFTEFVIAIQGQLGPQEGNVFTVIEPNIQVFEKKQREPKPATPEALKDPPKP